MNELFEANDFGLEPGMRLLEASAGTGKTFALAHLVLRFVAEQQLSLRQLLVVTFTEAAAAELRDRIGQRLQQALAGLEDPSQEPPDDTLAVWLRRQAPRAEALRARLLLALEELDQADITTIHGFCRRTLQRQALEAALPPELQLDTDSSALVRQVVHDYWQQQVLALPAHLLAGLQRSVKGPAALEPLLQSLDGDPALQLDPLPAPLVLDQPLAAQLEALWSQKWEGFCTLWQQRGRALEADLCAAAEQWRALGIKTTPYSPKPRTDRCGQLDIWIAQIGPAGDYGATVDRQAGPQSWLRDYFHPGAFLKLARPLEGHQGAHGPEDPSLPQRPLMEAIAQLVEGPAEALLLHALHWGRAELRRRRERAGRLGFAQLLEGLDPGERPSTPLLAAVGERYAVALIDEFQDTDPIQWRILARAFGSQVHRLVMVGDPKQAIYRFRGGELATYLAARRSAAAAGGISRLQANHRSREPLVKALNSLMAPGLRRSGLEVPPVEARAAAAPALPQVLQSMEPLQLLWLGGKREAGAKPPSRTQLELQLQGQIASYTAGLLNQGFTPGQICVLVSTHAQAEGLRSALERCAVASRLVSTGDVFQSPAATALQRFLDALADPAHPGRLRLLAASSLLGWSATQLVAADAESWSALAGLLARMAEQLPVRGLLGLLGSLIQERGVAQLSLGGRLLADLQQCGELVQERLHADRLGPAAAADWLRRLRLDPEREVPEAHLPHSDVADAAVSVVTVHRSKGLEYPVVICPYLWQAPSSGGAGRLGVRWHPPGAPGPRLDLHLSPHWGSGHAAQRQQLEASLQEHERLAYVAATRAQWLLVLAWGPAAGQQGNPLHPWLFSQHDPPGLDHDPYGERSDAAWRQALEEEITLRRLPLNLLEPPAAGVVERYRAATPGDRPPLHRPPLQRGPVPLHGFDSSWGRSSYTSWTHGSHGVAPQALEEGRETDGLIGGEQEAADLLEPLWPEQGPLAQFPRGSQAGDCLHRILEQLDYQRPVALQLPLLQRELERAGIPEAQLEAAQLGLEQLRHTPMGGALGSFALAQLAGPARLNEMNFDLPLGLVRAPALAAPFAHHPAGAFGIAYAEQLAQLEVASQGFLTGSIDLVFCHQQRWWVADWKSNWLGERDSNGQPLHCGPRHYGPDAMAALMAANHYPLQAHLYLVALHRYLRWRLPGYSPSQHLGGYVYVFLRGVPGPTGAAQVPGMVVDQPPLERLLELDRALEGPP